jgi:hypothetical protein
MDGLLFGHKKACELFGHLVIRVSLVIGIDALYVKMIKISNIYIFKEFCFVKETRIFLE